jgi:hypothetical protein
MVGVEDIIGFIERTNRIYKCQEEKYPNDHSTKHFHL